MAQGAIPQWQNGVVAIGARRSGGAEPTLMGTGWLVDLPAGLLCTCAHVVMDCYPHATSPALLDALTDGVAIGLGIGQSIRWLYRADLRYLSLPSTDVGYPHALPAGWSPADDARRLDLAVLQLTNSDGSPLNPPLNASGSAGWHRAGEDAIALPLGRSTPAALPEGSELVLLGYGQGKDMGVGSRRTSTTCPGAFQGYVSKADTGEWLKTGLTIYSGHSGGPALNARGEVIGWAVKSFNDLGPNGQLRPVEQLEAAVGQVLNKFVPARPSEPNVRHRLLGQLPAGTYCMGEGARAEQSADDARQSAENAHLHEQGALAHALFAASVRDNAASQASAAAEHASQAKGAAASAESSAAEAATTAAGTEIRAAAAVREEMRQSRLNVVQREAETHFLHANMLMQEAAELRNSGQLQLQSPALLPREALAVPAAQHSQLALSQPSKRQRVQQDFDMGSRSMSTGMNPSSFISWQPGIAQVQAGIDHGNPGVYGMVPLAQPQPQSKVLVMVYIDVDIPDFDEAEQAEFCMRLAKKLNTKDQLTEITRDQIRVTRMARAGADGSTWRASLQRGQCYVKVEVDEDGLFMPSYTSSSDSSSDFDASSSDMEEQAEVEVKEALRWAFGRFFPAERVELCYGPMPARSLWLAIRLPAPLALLLLEAARQRSPELLDEHVRCVRLIRNEMIRDQKEVTAQLDDRPDIEECLATLEREEATVLANVVLGGASRPSQAELAAFDEVTRGIIFAPNHFEALGLPLSAAVDSKQVLKAFRNLAKQVHPDKNLYDDEEAAAAADAVAAAEAKAAAEEAAVAAEAKASEAKATEAAEATVEQAVASAGAGEQSQLEQAVAVDEPPSKMPHIAEELEAPAEAVAPRSKLGAEPAMKRLLEAKRLLSDPVEAARHLQACQGGMPLGGVWEQEALEELRQLREAHVTGELLIFVGNAVADTFASTSAEADTLQQCFARHGRKAVVQHGGDATTLRELLERHRPRFLHFIGHADPLNRELTLGFTAPEGALITMLPGTVLELLTSLSAISFLELVVLNGCRSVAIADKVAAAGIPAIGWETVVDDKSAAAFTPPLYGHLIQHTDKPLFESLPAAFQQAVLAVKALTGTYAMANGDLPDGSGRRAAGLPVLVSRARFPPAVSGAKRLPPPAYPPADSVYGRDEQIRMLHEHFFPLQRLRADSSPAALGAAPARQAVLQAIRGLGGIGKTTLALEYARRHALSYPAGVAFVSADAASELELLQRIAQALTLYELASKYKSEVDELRDELHAWLRQNVGWLLIVDNADDAGTLSGALQRSLPASDALGHVLLTSRVGTEAFGALGIDAPLTLDVPAFREATLLLVREAGRAWSSLDDEERRAAEWLAGADALAGLPLALLQAGKMVREKKLSFARYRERFEKRYLEIFKAAPSGTQRQEQSVHTTWLLNLETLEEEEPAAAELLSLCSRLAPGAIPAATLFVRLVQGEDGEEGIDFARAAEVCPELVKALDGLDEDERQEKIEELLGAAQRYSLLDFDADAAGDAWRSVSMHRLVQDAQRRRAKRATEAVGLLSKLLVAAMPGIEEGMACTGEAMERFRRLRPHVVALWKEAARLGAVRREVAALLDVAATALVSNGEYAEAEAMQREVLAALAAEHEVLGPPHPDMLRAMGNLAVTLRELGKPAEAEVMEREVLAARRKELGVRNPSTLTAMDNLASTLRAQGKPAEAEAMEREVLVARREVLGARHPDTLTAMGNLASTLGDLGKHAEAERMQREALAGYRATLGDAHPHTLTSINNLGGLLQAQGDMKNAAPLYREALAGCRATLGDTHPNTLQSINNLGALLEDQGDLDGAAPLYREALAGMRATLGDTHPDTLEAISNLTQLERQRRQLSGK